MSEKVKKIVDDQFKGAEEALVESLFNDFYKKRYHIYKMNFLRGIFFGLGSVLGGSVVLTLIVWILSLFISIPFLGDVVESIRGATDQ